ncbi:MAG: MoaD/ThiS family protein [candidate division NC10 bacterium]|nr:MoaD/ThiS family protein [candidate division NC10 bacterium]
MAVTVRIPTPLRALTGGKGDLRIEAANVRDLVDGLEKEHTGLKERLCESDGSFRRFINIYLNDEDIRFLQGADTGLKDGDEVSIVPAIAGGRQLRRPARRDGRTGQDLQDDQDRSPRSNPSFLSGLPRERRVLGTESLPRRDNSRQHECLRALGHAAKARPGRWPPVPAPDPYPRRGRKD